MDEGDVVARVVAVPDGKEHQGSGLTEQMIVEEPKPLVHVRHDPSIGVDVEAVNQLKWEQK